MARVDKLAISDRNLTRINVLTFKDLKSKADEFGTAYTVHVEVRENRAELDIDKWVTCFFNECTKNDNSFNFLEKY